MVVHHRYNSNYLGDGGKRIMNLSSTWSKLTRPYLKNKTQDKRARGHGSRCEALDLISQ
jgi:hypothetical protein